MLSVASLLNPIKPEPRGTRLPSSPSSSLYSTTSSHGSPQLSIQPSVKKQKMTKDGAVFAKGKIKGEVNYPPFEQFDEETLREIQKFEVFPLGKITDYCRHIPYNSEKKSFLEKTGRESFEVFQYIFKVPGDEKDYTVMWDYNIGLVRITPFFKCCNYSKTTPAKMLNQNPGLKEITHSITGGALAAQGYWMPYNCALAICATFCSHIAGALIPIFGPSFPSLCVPPEAPEHKRMIISPSLVQTATAQAAAYRLQYSSHPPSSSFSPKTTDTERDVSYSPISSTSISNLSSTTRNSSLLPLATRNTPPNPARRSRLKRAFGRDSPAQLYDTEVENSSSSSNSSTYFHSPSPLTPSTSSSNLWTARNNQNHAAHTANSAISISAGPSPWLSAIPRSTGLGGLDIDIKMPDSAWRRSGGQKRRARDLPSSSAHSHSHSHSQSDSRPQIPEADEEKRTGDSEYDGEESASVSVDGRESDKSEMEVDGVEKKAAWLLMKLSVKDGEAGPAADLVAAGDGPRVKRRRATSY